MDVIQAKGHMYREWDRGGWGGPVARCVHELFDLQAAKTPARIALRSRGRTMTYNELNDRANRLGHYLQSHGVRPESIVGVCMERSIEAVVAILAVLKAGGAYVMLDPRYPVARIQELIADSRPVLVVSTTSVRSRIAAELGRVICIDDTAGDIERCAATNPRTDVLPDNLAYVLYTSGSTGKPKGVLGVHRGITNRLAGTSNLELQEDDVWCLNVSLSFGFSLSRLFVPLLSGAQLVIMEDSEVKDIACFLNRLKAEGITSLGVVTSVLRQILTEDSRSLSRLSGIRVVTTGGEPLTAELAAKFRACLPQATLINGYGISELGGSASTSALIGLEHRVKIGSSFLNTSCYVLLGDMQRAPIGVEGELYVGAAHLARGYMYRPDLTAQRFVPDPFTVGGRLFRTGDRARYLSDGGIEFLGRKDYQVKVRGIRVDLLEVEAALQRIAAVKDAAVSVIHTECSDRLVAYVVVDSDTGVTVPFLRNELASRLPEYMLPSMFIFMTQLPMTIGGKIDRRSLPSPGVLRPNLGVPFESPRTHVESSLADIWTKVLGIDRVGIFDNLLDLGTDSLSAMQVSSRVREIHGMNLPVQVIFEQPTIAQLAMRMSDLDKVSVGSATVSEVEER